MEISLEFTTDDFLAAKYFFSNNLPSGARIAPSHGERLHDDLEIASILLEVSKIAVPSICALVGLWLGKGKSLTIKCKGKSLVVKNMSESAAKDLTDAFLNDQFKN